MERHELWVMEVDDERTFRGECAECRVAIGDRHLDDCPQGRCEHDGLTWLHCPEQRNEAAELAWDRIVLPRQGEVIEDSSGRKWTKETLDPPPHRPDLFVGVWAMERDCRRLGWFVRWDDVRGEFVRCHPAEPGAGPDITRLTTDGRWDWRHARWIRRKAVLYVRDQTAAAAKVQEGRLLAWADELGYEVVYVGSDVARQAAGFRACLQTLADPDKNAEAVLIWSQKNLGSSNDVRRKAVQKLRDAGGNLLSHELWADVIVAPESYAEAARLKAIERMGARPDGQE